MGILDPLPKIIMIRQSKFDVPSSTSRSWYFHRQLISRFSLLDRRVVGKCGEEMESEIKNKILCPFGPID
jgi:hypothetical protein